MKKALLISLVLLLAYQGFAQQLFGTVKDNNGETIPGVNITVDNSFVGTTTDASGQYSLNLSAGSYTIHFSFIGYEGVEKEVKIASTDVELNLSLKRMAYVSDEVIVQGTRISQKTPGSHQTLQAKEIEKNKMTQDIPYLLQLTPSVVATSESGTGIGYTSFRIRGTDPTRINITIDGIPYNDAESQSTFWVNMPDFASSVSSVQIQRGVGTSTNGSGAFGATMNFKTKAISSKPYASIDAQAGSYNTFKSSVKAGTGLIGDHFTVDARFSNINSDGYVDRAFVDHESFQLSAAYRDDANLLKATFIRGDQRTGISWWGTPKELLETNRTYNPAGEYTDTNGKTRYYDNQTDNYVQSHYYLHYTHLFNNHFNVNAALHYTRGDGYYEQYKEDATLSEYMLPNLYIGNDTIRESDLVRRKQLGNNFYGGVFSVNYTKGKIDASVGGGLNQYDGDHFGNIIWMQYAGNVEKDHEYYLNNGLKTDGNIYGKLNYSLMKSLNVYVDLQYRAIQYKMSGYDDELLNGKLRDLEQSHAFGFFNPKAGIYYQISPNQSVNASFANGHREPTRTHFKDATGDPNKTPLAESLLDYELGYQYRTGLMALGFNLYYMDYTNQLVPTGEKSSVGYDIMTNVKDSYRAGIELMGALKINDLLSWSLNATFSRNKIQNFTYYGENYSESGPAIISTTLDETDIAYSPSIVAGSRIDVSPLKGLNFGIVSKYVGKQYFDNTSNNLRSIDPYFVNNLELSYSLHTKLISQIAFKVQVNNVLNHKYSNNAYGGIYYSDSVEQTWSYYFPQAGRHYMAGITLTL